MTQTASETKALTAFKAFRPDLTCNGYQYAIGETFVHEGRVEICSSGFHACLNPLDVLNYYDLTDSRFARVSLSGKIDRKSVV